MTKTKYSLPWIESSIRRLIRKRKKLYFRARKSSSPDVKNHYKRFRAHVQKVIRDAYWKHISNIFSFEKESPDPGSPRKNEKAKKFWSFVKSLKNGINTLRENGILKTDTLRLTAEKKYSKIISMDDGRTDGGIYYKLIYEFGSGELKCVLDIHIVFGHFFCLERFRQMTLKIILKERGVNSVHSQVFMTLRKMTKPV